MWANNTTLLINILDRISHAGIFHGLNTILLGCLSFFHVFFPTKIIGYYSNIVTTEQQLKEQLILKFIGLFMFILAFISWKSRNDTTSMGGRTIVLGLSLYHICTCFMVSSYYYQLVKSTSSSSHHHHHHHNIMTDDENLWDYVHALNHLTIGMGFIWCYVRPPPLLMDDERLNRLKAPWIIVFGHNTSQDIGNKKRWLKLQLTLKNWDSAMNAIHSISKIAIELDHHPDLSLQQYRILTITIRTHCSLSNGLTDRDFDLASRIEQISFDLSPKWIRENTGLIKKWLS
jgi:pterin-4a-carbinolamine dehydratase